MNKPLSIRTVDPVSVAEKLDAVRNFLLPAIAAQIEAEPRLVEALWFLQWVSIPENYAGGLSKFAQDLLARFPDQIGTLEMLECRSEKPGPKSIQKMLEDFPHAVREEIIYAQDQGHCEIDLSALKAKALDTAKADLANFLQAVCEVEGCRFDGLPDLDWMPENLWYFPRLWKCVFAWMGEHAERVRAASAETSVTKEISRWLELAQESGKGVMFIGHSRFGKSRAIRSFATMYPGRVRIVETPSSSSEGDLLQALARALGIRYDRKGFVALHEQRATIDKVLRQANLMLIFDEAQFLFPQGGNKRAAPPRLNYVRRSIMDIGVPTAFVCTHQNWKDVEKNFLKVTGYAMEQFEGRLLRPPIHLANELTEAEMIEVARVHLPELHELYLRRAVLQMRPLVGGDLLSSIENVAIIARSYAKERGAAAPCLDDVIKAIEDALACATHQAKTLDLDPDAPAAKTSRRDVSPRPDTGSRNVRPAGFGDRASRVPAGTV